MTGVSNFGPRHDLAQRLDALEAKVAALATTNPLVNASVGKGPGYGLLLVDTAGMHILSSAGTTVLTVDSTTGNIVGVSKAVTVTGGLTVSGTKSFIQDHPTAPGWQLQHAATESPGNGVEYWGAADLDDTGQATVTLPGWFEALTGHYPDQRAVQVTVQGDTPAPASATPIAGGTFTVHGPASGAVWWHVLAVRACLDGTGTDTLAFAVEQPPSTTDTEA